MSRTLTSEKDWSSCFDEQSCWAQEAVDTEGRNSRGLKNIARLVGIKISEKGTTCYREIADEITQELSGNEKRSLTDERSIRRRVYDALNILLAMKLIKKECRSIQWHGPNLALNKHDTSNRLHSISPSMKTHCQQEQPSFGCSSAESSELRRNIQLVKKPLLVIAIPRKNGKICVNSSGDLQTLKLRSCGNAKLFDENILNHLVFNEHQ